MKHLKEIFSKAAMFLLETKPKKIQYSIDMRDVFTNAKLKN